MERAQKIGIELYNEEQAKKADILHMLLSDYNDGHRKTFYCVAVNLLPLQDLENVMNQIAEDASFNSLKIKEKAEKAVSLFQNLAIQQELELKLRKKPTK